MKTSLGAKTLIYPTPVVVVATYDKAGKANMMTAAWAGVCCSKPPCITVSLRKATYTYSCLLERGAYTANLPSRSQLEITDYVGTASGRDRDKFADTGLTAVASELVDAPYVAEFAVNLECRILHTLDLGLHTMFIAEVLDAKVDPEVLDAQGLPDPAKVRPLAYTPWRQRYHALGEELAESHKVGKRLMNKS